MKPLTLPISVLILLPAIGPVRADEAIRVVIGTKSFTESVLLGEMLAALARDAGATVELKADLGGTGLAWKAIKSGQIDAYVEYTGTLSTEILREARLQSKDLPGLRRELSKHGLLMTYPLGFNNSYALGMLETKAAEVGISCISDLKNHPDLRIRLSDEFTRRPDGWSGLKAHYELPQESGGGLDHTIALRSLANGAIDLTDLYTTDAEIPQLRLRALADDQGYFPRYQAVVLLREDLAQRAPRVVEAFRKLEAAIDTETMSRLNAAVVVGKQPAARVAAEYLRQEHALPVSLPEGNLWGDLLNNGLRHLYLVAISLAAAVLVSIPLGILAYKVPSIGALVMGIVGIVQTIPSLALLVFLLPLFKLGAGTAIAAMFLYSLLPIVRNTYTGLTTVPGNLKEAAEVLGLPWYARLWRVELPLATPSILAGIKIAAVVNVGTATIGALVGAGGYGQPIVAGLRLNDVNLILQGAIPAAVLALLVQGVFSLLETFFVPQGLRLQTAR